jgi:hypothetical protein
MQPTLASRDVSNVYTIEPRWGSNPRPADYEKYGPSPRVRYLHGHHGVAPPVALIALFARVTLVHEPVHASP